MSTFDSLYENVLNSLVKRKVIEDISLSFSACKTDNDKIAKVFNLLQDESVIPIFCRLRVKDKDLSIKLRNEGNLAFKNKELSIALQYYSKSIAHAPNGSEELSKGYANRSAVFLAWKFHDLCVMDINRAIQGSYPENLKYKLYERKAKCFFEKNNFISSKKYFKSAEESILKTTLKEETKKNYQKTIQLSIKLCDQAISSKIHRSANSLLSSFLEDNVDPTYHPSDTALPKLSSEKNSTIIGASDAVKLVSSEKSGRCLYATKDIYPGDVLVVEKPFSSILLPDLYSTHCYECYQRHDAMIPCLQCTLIMFCSQKCRSRSWDKCHRIECPILPTVLSLKFSKMELLALRTLIIATDQGSKIEALRDRVKLFSQNDADNKGLNSSQKYDSSDYCSIHHLETNETLRSNADIFRRSATAAFLLHLLQHAEFFDENSEKSPDVKTNGASQIFNEEDLSENELFCGSLLKRYLQSLPCNAHEVSEMIFSESEESIMVQNSLEVGAVAYPVLSLINHSCDPNVVRHSHNGDTVVLRAIQTIKQGSELFDNYGYHHAVHSRSLRQKHLREQYYFECECVACTDDWPLYKDQPTADPTYLTEDSDKIKKLTVSSNVFRKILEEVTKWNDTRHLKILYKHLFLLQKTIQRPWKEFSECQETIKQCFCFSIGANHRIIRSESK